MPAIRSLRPSVGFASARTTARPAAASASAAISPAGPPPITSASMVSGVCMPRLLADAGGGGKRPVVRPERILALMRDEGGRREAMTDAEFWEVERSLWLGGPAAFRAWVAADCVMVFPEPPAS